MTSQAIPIRIGLRRIFRIRIALIRITLIRIFRMRISTIRIVLIRIVAGKAGSELDPGQL
ncbi:MAG: hypothetical protein METHAR1v1_1210017 [Methanothrix sp.]|nr:MAG: hypothetical protein METHAR1v1_1210017 [Methanothrix sp.]